MGSCTILGFILQCTGAGDDALDDAFDMCKGHTLKYTALVIGQLPGPDNVTLEDGRVQEEITVRSSDKHSVERDFRLLSGGEEVSLQPQCLPPRPHAHVYSKIKLNINLARS